MKNTDKINTIIEKYKDRKFKYFEDFYEDIISNKPTKCFIKVSTIPKVHKKLIHFNHILNDTDKKITFNNYKIKLVGNTGGLSFGIINKRFLKNRYSDFLDILRREVIQNGGKFYLNVDVTKIISLSNKSLKKLLAILEKETYYIPYKKFIFNNKKYYYENKSGYLSDKSKNVNLVIIETDQLILMSNFIFDLFYEIDKMDFIDVMGIKFFNHQYYRKDKINIYISNEIKNNKEKMENLLKIIKNLILKYQKLGLKFSKDNFILPYEFDNERIIANTYIPGSFYKSLLYHILMFISFDENLVKNYFSYNPNIIKEDEKYLEKILIYLKKNDKNNKFEDFVFKIFEILKKEDIDDYLKTYKLLFEY